MSILGEAPTDSEDLRVLAVLLGAPNAESAALLADMSRFHPWLEPAARQVARMPLDQWQSEHLRLFITGHPTTPCPPFESAYRQGTALGDATEKLTILYRRADLEVTEGVPADFLGTMLDCLAHLANHSELADVRDALWQDHLSWWLPRFAQDLASHAKLDLYRVLAARLTDLFLETAS